MKIFREGSCCSRQSHWTSWADSLLWLISSYVFNTKHMYDWFFSLCGDTTSWISMLDLLQSPRFKLKIFGEYSFFLSFLVIQYLTLLLESYSAGAIGTFCFYEDNWGGSYSVGSIGTPPPPNCVLICHKNLSRVLWASKYLTVFTLLWACNLLILWTYSAWWTKIKEVSFVSKPVAIDVCHSFLYFTTFNNVLSI